MEAKGDCFEANFLAVLEIWNSTKEKNLLAGYRLCHGIMIGAKDSVIETSKPVQSVASAQRSVKQGRQTVRLTSSQVAIAKKLGVPLEEYAKQLKLTKEA